ncbi:signal peptidase I [Buchnera aphidicola (Mollitrichosiphum nigrofasciatum)]|uniref:signal peptidase I n=1 Tax=Buchnera aphidicola TaxID=9 RepID=UPI0031B84F07
MYINYIIFIIFIIFIQIFSFKKKKKILISFLIVVFMRTFIYELFYIPSNSMNPNLLIGDIIIVSKYIYNIKNPFTKKILLNFKIPEREDIIVFKYPYNTNKYFIKRIIGLPEEYIIYDTYNKNLNIYKKDIFKKNCYKKIFVSYIKNNNKFNYYNYFQEIINNKKIQIILKKKYTKKTQKIHFYIPKKYYFVMGDNRDDSFDSRYWGVISEEEIVGKATNILFNCIKNTNYFLKNSNNRILNKIN